MRFLFAFAINIQGVKMGQRSGGLSLEVFLLAALNDDFCCVYALILIFSGDGTDDWQSRRLHDNHKRRLPFQCVCS
jgi:hypothetical protein